MIKMINIWAYGGQIPSDVSPARWNAICKFIQKNFGVKMRNKILLLGSGELGKELVIAMQRLGQYVIAVDNYENAPAMQVAHEFEVINMLDGDALDKIVEKHNPPSLELHWHCLGIIDMCLHPCAGDDVMAVVRWVAVRVVSVAALHVM